MGNGIVLKKPERGAYLIAAKRLGKTKQAVWQAFRRGSHREVLAVWEASKRIADERNKNLQKAAQIQNTLQPCTQD